MLDKNLSKFVKNLTSCYISIEKLIDKSNIRIIDPSPDDRYRDRCDNAGKIEKCMEHGMSAELFVKNDCKAKRNRHQKYDPDQVILQRDHKCCIICKKINIV